MKIGLPVVALVVAAYAASNGTPHWLHEAECAYNGRGCVYYMDCTYIGVQGWRRFIPNLHPDEDCPHVKFFALDWPPFVWHPRLIR